MISAGQDINAVLINFVNHSVLIVDPPAPISRQVSYQRLWFPNPYISVPADIFNQLIDFFLKSSDPLSASTHNPAIHYL